jgi:hypothetical protein
MRQNRSTRTFSGVEYAPDRQFRVVAKGLSLIGLVPSQHAGAYDGWSQPLEPGDMLICTGYGPGFGSDPGCGVEFRSAESDAANALHCSIRPTAGGMFDYRPDAGALEPIEQ